MVNLIKLFSLFVSFICLSLMSCKDASASIPEDDTTKDDGTEVMDTMEYRALVYVDEPSLNKRYGGEEKFMKDLKVMFENTTKFWNNSKNKFNYYFRFVPYGLYVYDYVEGQSDQAATDKAKEPLDNQYDFVVFFNLASPDNVTSCGGGDGHTTVWLKRTLETQEKDGDIFHDGVYPTKLGTYSNLGHEYGHYRGATDLYQYPISAKNNPINGEEFHPGPCNMGTGEWEWSDYASAMFNYTAKWKRLPDGFHGLKLIEGIELTVKKNGNPVPGSTVKLYGCRGGGGEKGLPSGDNGPDVYKEPFRTFTTDSEGKVKISDVYHLYQVKTDGSEILPDPLPWNYWFNFLVEASYGNEKAYIWMPDLEIQRQCMAENVTVYKADIILK